MPKKDSMQNKKALTEVLNEKDFDRVEPLLIHLEEHGEITPKDAEALLKRSTSTVYRYLGKLVDVGVLEPQGSTNDKVYIRKR